MAKAKKTSKKRPPRRETKTPGPAPGEPGAPTKLWGGRFRKGTHPAVERLTESLSFDRRLYHHDIEGSIAHAAMLAKIGVLTEAEKRKIEKGLRTIEKEIAEGSFNFEIEQEDIH
ncbi:MAG: hypothetical protein R6V58_04420, partial [Planctomycetota bacterium]